MSTRPPPMGPAERRAALAALRARRAYVAPRPAAPQPERGLVRFHQAPGRPPEPAPPSAPAIAAALSLGRLIDATPGLLGDWRAGRPVLVDVADRVLLDALKAAWREPFGIGRGAGAQSGDSADDESTEPRGVAAVLYHQAEVSRSRDLAEAEAKFVRRLAWGEPVLGLSPSAQSHLPGLLVRVARHRLALPPIDAATLARTIALVTGRGCAPDLLERIRYPVDGAALAVIRTGRTPQDCVEDLERAQADPGLDRSRAIALDDLHGLDPAVAWARGALADLEAWRRGEIGWDQVAHGAVLDGPPGTGKTLFARVLAEAAGLPLIVGSLARWQSRGHLGDLLKAMSADFARARAESPSILFIDEIDAFGDRSTFTSDHRDYSVQVVNALLEHLDGAAGREGLFFLAASNEISRCDPAMLRSGRLNTLIRIGLPDAAALEAMLRVRLRGDLAEIDLSDLAASATGLSGADIEQLVRAGRARARRAKRPLTLDDLTAALGAELPPEPLRRRTAVHEAGHAIAVARLLGPGAVVEASIFSRPGAHGTMSWRTTTRPGTLDDLEGDITVLLAGRAAEAVLCGSVSAGAGGPTGSDLERATRIAAAAIGAFGLAGPHPEVWLAEAERTGAILAHATARAAVAALLGRLHGAATELIRSERDAVERVAQALADRGRVGGDELRRLIANFDGAEPSHR